MSSKIDATRLLDILAPGERITFQTFDDRKSGSKGLTRILHGDLQDHIRLLHKLNDRGAGIFWMVNHGDMKGRKAENVVGVRAVFVDLDGSPLEPVMAGPILPHATVESSPGRFHAYWRVAGLELAEFVVVQAALATMFNGDPVVKDLPRVMRLPGFYHWKEEPFLSRILSVRDTPPIGADTLWATYLPDRPRRATECVPERIPEGQRNTALFGLACGFVNRGIGLPGLRTRMLTLNRERCDPPLPVEEVELLVASAFSTGSSAQFTLIPNSVLDSVEWRRLSHGAREVIICGYRKHSGRNNGNIDLTWSDHKNFRGWGNKQTFIDARNEAMESGFLLVAQDKGYTRKAGARPYLFELAHVQELVRYRKPNSSIISTVFDTPIYKQGNSFDVDVGERPQTTISPSTETHSFPTETAPDPTENRLGFKGEAA